MPTKINYSTEARIDLDNIYDYIHSGLKNPIAAQNTVAGIISSIDELKDIPDLGKKVLLKNDFFSGYRYVSFKNYFSFYRIEGSEIFVDRILYSKSDYMSVLFGYRG